MYSNCYFEDGVTKILRNVDIFCRNIPGVIQSTTIFIVTTVMASKFVLQKYFISHYSNYNYWVLASNCKISSSSTKYYRQLFFPNSFKRI